MEKMEDKKIITEEEKFKSSPLGFLMGVIAKYQAYMSKAFLQNKDADAGKKSEQAQDMLDNLKIELSKTDGLKKELSNEAVMMHVVEGCSKDERNFILECVFDYLNLLDDAIENLEQGSADRNDAVAEHYNVSRLGLILNCYLGDFNNDDFFYGVLAEMSDAAGIEGLSERIVGRIEKAGIDLSFGDFVKNLCDEISDAERIDVYNKIILAYSERLLDKVLTQEVDEEEVNRLACAKQIQRVFEKCMQ